MSYLSAAEAWVLVVRHVRQAFDDEGFRQWLTLVGSGDDFDRCRKGEEFYKLMAGETAVGAEGKRSPIVEVPYERPGLQVQRKEES